MGKGNYGLLLVMMEPALSVEEEFNEWYDTEHAPTRLSVQGFLSSQRYIIRGGYPRYLSLFDLEDTGILQSEAYVMVSGVHASPWSMRMFRHVGGLCRNVYEQILPGSSIASKDADGLLLIFEDVELSKEEEINQWYSKEHAARVGNIGSVVNFRRFVCIDGSPKYLNLYEVEHVDSLEEDECKGVLRERASRVRKFTRNVRRNVYEKHAEKSFKHIKFFS